MTTIKHKSEGGENIQNTTKTSRKRQYSKIYLDDLETLLTMTKDYSTKLIFLLLKEEPDNNGTLILIKANKLKYAEILGCKYNTVNASIQDLIKKKILISTGHRSCYRLNSEYFAHGTEEVKIKKNYLTYLMLNNRNGYYKIGKSVNPKFREKTLQSEEPEVELIHVIYKDVESRLHTMFAGKRLRGEWFALDENEVNSEKLILRQIFFPVAQ